MKTTYEITKEPGVMIRVPLLEGKALITYLHFTTNCI